MMQLTGTGALLRLALRRDRTVLTAWLALIVLLAIGTVRYYLGVLGTEALRLDYARDIAATPALAAFGGQVDAANIGVLSGWRMRDMSYVLIALMAILTVVRHTRAEEESGRQELVGAAVVGRFAPLTAGLIVAAGASTVAAAGSALGVVALGVDPVGCLAYGSAAAGVGWVFSAVAALAAQVSAAARGAIGGAVAVLGAAYLLRFAADGSGEPWLRWFTPLGWAHLLRPYAGERWAVLALPLAAAAVLTGAAFVLLGRRDLGAGMWPERRGPANGHRLTGAFALAWRLQRGLLLGWVGGFAVAGVFFGGLVGAVHGSGADLVARSPQLQRFIQLYTDSPTAGLADAFLWTIALTLGYTAALYPALAIVALRREETSGHAELLLATSVDRRRWAAGHLAVAAAGTVAVLAAAGITSGLVYGLAVAEPATQLPRLLAGTLIQVPAAWVLGGVTMLAVGVVPRAAVGVAWAGFLFIQLFEVFVPIAGLDLPLAQAVVPHWHLPKVLVGGEFAAAPLLALTAVTALLTGLGLLGLRRRDLT